jgi:ATP-dependent helicase/nuclease subunit A
MSETTKKTTWTPEQRKAIGYEKGYDNCQLLVAAGAGSGKTSVLTERILKKIKEGKDVTDFLVVTFTVASAEDMKEKLRKKLMSEYAEHPDNRYLSNQIAKLPFARISTITSFCLDLVKKNFTALGISPNVRMADENEAGLLFEKALDLLFDEEFENKSTEIHNVLALSACRNKEKFFFLRFRHFDELLPLSRHDGVGQSSQMANARRDGRICRRG